MSIKAIFCTVTGGFASCVAAIFGGWDAALATLLIFMAVDYATGLIVAGIFHRSKKSESGALESRAGFKGLCKKGVALLFVLIAYRLDITIGVDYIRDGVIWAFLANELISIIENAGLMGIPLPAILTRAVELLQAKPKEVESKEV